MSANSTLLVLKLVSEGVGVANEISELAKRVMSGDIITDAEIEEARRQVANSVDNWNSEAQSKT